MGITIILRSRGTVDEHDPPDGVTVRFHNVAITENTVNYTLSLSIETASLLNNGMITCDPGVIGIVDMAEYPVAGEFNYVWCSTCSIIIMKTLNSRQCLSLELSCICLYCADSSVSITHTIDYLISMHSSNESGFRYVVGMCS